MRSSIKYRGCGNGASGGTWRKKRWNNVSCNDLLSGVLLAAACPGAGQRGVGSSAECRASETPVAVRAWSCAGRCDSYSCCRCYLFVLSDIQKHCCLLELDTGGRRRGGVALVVGEWLLPCLTPLLQCSQELLVSLMLRASAGA